MTSQEGEERLIVVDWRLWMDMEMVAWSWDLEGRSQ